MTNISFKRRYLSLLLFVITLCCFSSIKAQNRFYEEGYVVTNSGDTINGFIKRVRYSVLYNGIDFKYNLDEATTSKHYFPDSLLSFCFTKDNELFDRVEYKTINNNNLINKKLFAQLLVRGKLNLYRLNILDPENSSIYENENNHIYIVKKDTTYVVLRMFEKVIETQYSLDRDYITALGNLMNNCIGLIDKINNLGFSDKEMKNIVTEYNTKTSNTKNIVYNKHSSFKIKQGITASYYTFNNDFKVRKTNAFSVGYFWDILNPNIHEYISLMAGINYFRYTDSSNTNYSYLSIPLLSTINLSNKKIAPFINIGITTYVYNFYKMYNYFFLINFGVGAYINNKVFISLNTEHEINDIFNRGNLFNSYGLNFKVGVKLK